MEILVLVYVNLSFCCVKRKKKKNRLTDPKLVILLLFFCHLELVDSD